MRRGKSQEQGQDGTDPEEGTEEQEGQTQAQEVIQMAELKLIYEGTDITEYVDIMECVYRDTSGKECDCLNMKVDHAEKWMRWGPRKNDTIQAKRGGYDTKALYLNTITLEDGAYRIYATSVRSGMFAKKWQAYQNATLGRTSCERRPLHAKRQGRGRGGRTPASCRRREGAGGPRPAVPTAREVTRRSRERSTGEREFCRGCLRSSQRRTHQSCSRQARECGRSVRLGRKLEG